MIHLIIALVIILIVISLIRGTYIEIYKDDIGAWRPVFVTGFQAKLRIWHLLITIILSLIPIANVILFLTFIFIYIIHCAWNPKECRGTTHVFYLRDNTLINKIILGAITLLNKTL